VKIIEIERKKSMGYVRAQKKEQKVKENGKMH